MLHISDWNGDWGLMLSVPGTRLCIWIDVKNVGRLRGQEDAVEHIITATPSQSSINAGIVVICYQVSVSVVLSQSSLVLYGLSEDMQKWEAPAFRPLRCSLH